MNYTTTISALFGTALTMGSINAATIAVSASNGVNPSITSGGGGATIAITKRAIDGAAPQNIVYTISGLDLNGTADDEVVVTFSVTTDGQNINVAGVGDFTLSSGGVNLNKAGEFVQMTITSVVVNVDGGSGNGTGSFNGFSNITMGTWDSAGGDAATINGTEFKATATNQTFAATGNSWKALYGTTADGGAGAWRIANWEFSVEANAVPEPSSAALLGLGGLALVFRRRK